MSLQPLHISQRSLYCWAAVRIDYQEGLYWLEIGATGCACSSFWLYFSRDIIWFLCPVPLLF